MIHIISYTHDMMQYMNEHTVLNVILGVVVALRFSQALSVTTLERHCMANLWHICAVLIVQAFACDQQQPNHGFNLLFWLWTINCALKGSLKNRPCHRNERTLNLGPRFLQSIGSTDCHRWRCCVGVLEQFHRFIHVLPVFCSQTV